MGNSRVDRLSEQEFFEGKIEDLIQRERRGEPMAFSSFLTAEEATLAVKICKKAGASFLLNGGYPNAERKMLAVSAMEPETLALCYPIALLMVRGGDISALSNRDVLGALMATGIRRDILGDVVVREGQALVFVTEHMKEFLIQNVTSIGRQNIQLIEAPQPYSIPEPRFEHLRLTVASLRLDAVVGGLVHLSREQASRMIEEKTVSINHETVSKKIKEIHAGDCLAIRGFGKWLIDECGEQTKKGRAILLCRKYI